MKLKNVIFTTVLSQSVTCSFEDEFVCGYELKPLFGQPWIRMLWSELVEVVYKNSENSDNCDSLNYKSTNESSYSWNDLSPSPHVMTFFSLSEEPDWTGVLTSPPFESTSTTMLSFMLYVDGGISLDVRLGNSFKQVEAANKASLLGIFLNLKFANINTRQANKRFINKSFS